jgi:hypothetical protein
MSLRGAPTASLKSRKRTLLQAGREWAGLEILGTTMRHLPPCLLALPLVAGCSGCQDGSQSGTSAPLADGAAGHAGYHDASAPETSAEAGPKDAGLDVKDAAQEQVQPPQGNPVWTALAAPVAGCAVDKLTNASDLKLFNWQPCTGLSSCEEAVFNPSLIAATSQMLWKTRVSDDGTRTVAGVAYQSADGLDTGVYFVQEDGQLFGGFRSLTTAEQNCDVYGTSLWDKRFGVMIGMIPPQGKNRWGGLVGQLDSPASAAPFEILSLPAGGPEQDTLGMNRWLWHWYPDQLTSMSNVDGTGFTIFAHISQSLLILDLPVVVD